MTDVIYSTFGFKTFMIPFYLREEFTSKTGRTLGDHSIKADNFNYRTLLLKDETVSDFSVISSERILPVNKKY